MRALVAIIGLLMLLGAAASSVLSGSLSLVLWLAVLGAVILIGVMFERVHYKTLAQKPPGPGWIATPERFVDPATRHLVQVYVKPETGERCYVAIDATEHSPGA